MSATSWQAPILFELDDLADQPREKKVYKKPLIVPDEGVATLAVAPIKPVVLEEKIQPEKMKESPLPIVKKTVAPKKEVKSKPEKQPILKKVEKAKTEKTEIPSPEPYAKPYQVQTETTTLSAHLDTNIPLNPMLKTAQERVKQSLQAPKILPQWLIKNIKLPQDSKNTWFYSPWIWLLGSLLSLYLMLLLVDAVALLQQQFHNGFFLGTLFTFILGSIFTAIGYLSWRTYQDILHLKTVQQLHQEGIQLRTHNGYGQALTYVKKINQLYLHREANKQHIDRFYIAVDNCHSNQEVCTLYSQRVLQPIDQQAQAIVAQRAGETALMVVFSPFPLLSTVLTLWRNLKMMRDIAHLYGGHPSFIASMNLSMMVIQNLIYAGVSEVIANSIARLFDKSLSSILAGQMSQGIGSAIISARIGLKTIELCRPMPFAEDEQPKLKHIAKEVSDLLKSFIKKEK